MTSSHQPPIPMPLKSRIKHTCHIPLYSSLNDPLSSRAYYDMCADSISFLTAQNTDKNNVYTLEQLANRYQLSPTQFQQVFTSLVGVNPMQFQQALFTHKPTPKLNTHSHQQNTLDFELPPQFDPHNAFVSIKTYDPAEFASLDDRLVFSWAIEPSIFGPLVVIATEHGLNYLGFYDTEESLNLILQKRHNDYPKAIISQANNNQILNTNPFVQPSNQQPINICISASDFQLQVWQTLLTTTAGELLSYKNIAEKLNRPSAARAVGRAIGSNPIAFFIPCHRVIQQNGGLSGYRWGVEHKHQLIAWEQALVSAQD